MNSLIKFGCRLRSVNDVKVSYYVHKWVLLDLITALSWGAHEIGVEKLINEDFFQTPCLLSESSKPTMAYIAT